MDDNKIDEKVVDGEIVNENLSQTTESTLTEDNSTVISSLDEMIKLNFKRIGELAAEQKQAKDMIEDALAGSENYKNASEKAQESTNEKNSVKKTLQSTPEMLNLLNKLKEIASELKEKKLALSDYVLEYQRLSGATEVDLGNGEVMQIENSAKLVKRK